MATDLKCQCGYMASDEADLREHKKQAHGGEMGTGGQGSQRQSRQGETIDDED